MSRMQRIWNSDVGYSFRTSPVAIGATLVALVCVFCAVFAGWVAPHNPFDLATLDLANARLPPAWTSEGSANFVLGTDDQGRDILSALM
ncbi:MAG: ABC transporter permease, partial [Rhodoferax sp.]|nr:ABC transporter permease [Rhodoferax sp.]